MEKTGKAVNTVGAHKFDRQTALAALLMLPLMLSVLSSDWIDGFTDKAINIVCVDTFYRQTALTVLLVLVRQRDLAETIIFYRQTALIEHQMTRV